MNRLCYISRNYRNLDGAGNKAKTDNEDTLSEMGATNLGLRRTLYPNKVVTFLLDLAGVIKYVFCIRRSDVVLLQYPVKKYFAFLCNVAHWRDARTVTLIHDLGSFRRKKLTVKKEIDRLMHADYVIASNDTMKQWLIDRGYRHPVGALGLFDYRSEALPTPHTPGATPRLVYAGALAMRKNAFLLQLANKGSLPYELHIFGNRDGLPGMKDNDSIVFHSFTPADDFISHVDADYGFVWDGDSLDSCTGNFGEYLRWNSPHKVSFYIRAGLPIIIWNQAALATVIEHEGIGFGIMSVEELESKLRNVSPQQLTDMQENVKRVAERLKRGQYLRDAISEAIRTLDTKV